MTQSVKKPLNILQLNVLLHYYRNSLALYKFILYTDRWMSKLIMSKYIYLFKKLTDAAVIILYLKKLTKFTMTKQGTLSSFYQEIFLVPEITR